MNFKNLCVLVLWTKVAPGLEGLIWNFSFSSHVVTSQLEGLRCDYIGGK